LIAGSRRHAKFIREAGRIEFYDARIAVDSRQCVAQIGACLRFGGALLRCTLTGRLRDAVLIKSAMTAASALNCLPPIEAAGNASV
jgi:hypothetical protein